LIIGAHIFCANVGDSRAVLSKKGKAINLSLDHKASRPDEVARIIQNDGQIEFGRVGAKLAITRAFGDFEFKHVIDENGDIVRKHFITSDPEIRRYDFNPFEDEFIVLASDGLFDMFNSQEAVDFIREKMLKQ
jgi:serine/threonine protein phosphatase PrpC